MRFGLRSKDLSLTYLKATQPPSILRPPLSHLRELVVVQDCKVSIYNKSLPKDDSIITKYLIENNNFQKLELASFSNYKKLALACYIYYLNC